MGTAAATAALKPGGTATRVRPSVFTTVPRQPVDWPNTESPTLHTRAKNYQLLYCHQGEPVCLHRCPQAARGLTDYRVSNPQTLHTRATRALRQQLCTCLRGTPSLRQCQAHCSGNHCTKHQCYLMKQDAMQFVRYSVWASINRMFSIDSPL